jgi:hypothetical protein
MAVTAKKYDKISGRQVYMRGIAGTHTVNVRLDDFQPTGS